MKYSVGNRICWRKVSRNPDLCRMTPCNLRLLGFKSVKNTEIKNISPV